MSRPEIVVVGLGPAGPELLTAATAAAIAADHHYERSETIDAVYDAIVEDLVAAARRDGRVLYAVPGSPAVAERTVELLRADDRVSVEVLPALSCADLAWVRLGVDPLAGGARIVDGHRFAVEAARALVRGLFSPPPCAKWSTTSTTTLLMPPPQ